ncbi:MAG: EAL domain-containing protein [Bacilli bacterium]|nr:EAL domain-containing protein [Bacilli bacterium]
MNKENKKNSLFHIKKTILAVDDEDINLDIMASILGDDFNVLKADDGKVALDILLKKEQKIDLVLLDVFMPMDGREVLKTRQTIPFLKSIPFIVCTSDKNIEKECFLLGANDFIKKPYENKDIIIARIKRMIELYEDRSILKEVEKDSLTDLYNIDFFKKYAQQFDVTFPDVKKDMLAISINRFRLINELYGKSIGDAILLSVANQLKECISNCNGLIGKYESNAFLIYCEHHDDYDTLSYKIREAINKVEQGINISFSIGVYPFVDSSLDKEIAIGRSKATADTLTNDYNQNIAIYDQDKQATTLHEEELVNAFPQALLDEEFQLYFQPKYNVQGDKPVFSSAEVLIRWVSPKFGFVSPGEFISLFEKNGLISKLDMFILQKAAQYMNVWKQKYGLYVPLSINLSRVDVFRPNLVDDIIRFVEENIIPRDKYMLEITESAFVENAKIVVPIIKQIRERGFKIEIDDFGSGYSSFAALADLPFDVLKIDMQFIRSMDKNPKVKDIIKMIIDLSKTMNALTVAEGVENEEQYLFLKNSGCDIIQGYYFSKPLALDEFEKKIKEELF